ncbi:hypothetical protein EVA_13943 [gut metagenome]|uniref:Uncharacterized protein n=1 Tax=gut metagenome TaxID=749906 RepID=J9CDA1_9ZZZZ
MRISRIRCHKSRAETVSTTSPLAGFTRGQLSSASASRIEASILAIKASVRFTPWCRLRAFRFWSPVGLRISIKGMMSGWSTGKKAA